MGVIKDKVAGWIRKATETATDTVKQITKEDATNTLDILGDLAKIGCFVALTVGAFKASSTTSKVVQTVAAADVLQPIAQTAQTAAPVVQIFLGEGKGVHIQ